MDPGTSITRSGASLDGIVWDVMGQTYKYPMADCDPLPCGPKAA